MSTDPKEVVRRFFEAFSRHDPDEIASYVTEDLIHHSSSNQGREGVKEEARYWLNAVPDASFTIEDIVREGDRVAVRGRGGGTHRGEFFGVPGTGRQIEVAEMHFLRVENGLIAEIWSNVDVYGLLAQIGAVEPSMMEEAV
jgi:steroid delta-isomerase-like uncharacterized protein